MSRAEGNDLNSCLISLLKPSEFYFLLMTETKESPSSFALFLCCTLNINNVGGTLIL